MSKLKANTVENVAGTKSFLVDDIPALVSPDWNGILLDETTTPKLSEVGIIGTTPVATLYPDGSIVGSSDNGTFTKWANGDLDCRGISSELSTLNAIVAPITASDQEVLTYPIVFVATPSAYLSCRISANYAWIGAHSLTTADITVRLLGVNTDQSGFVEYMTKGRWKW